MAHATDVAIPTQSQLNFASIVVNCKYSKFAMLLQNIKKYLDQQHYKPSHIGCSFAHLPVFGCYYKKEL